MTTNQLYEFDRTGYLVISDMLTKSEVKELAIEAAQSGLLARLPKL